VKEELMPEFPQTGTARRQLERLGTLTDVVYGVALVLIIQWLPLPEESHSGGVVWLLDLWAEYAGNIVSVIIGLVFTIIYWLRSNTLMAALDRTDGVHTGLSIASLFFFLLLVYVVRVSAEVAAPSRRAGESVAVALIGIAAGAAWWWARRRSPDRGLCRAPDRARDAAIRLCRRAFLESRLVRLHPNRRLAQAPEHGAEKRGMNRGLRSGGGRDVEQDTNSVARCGRRYCGCDDSDGGNAGRGTARL
jgi:uncharacterized membrane protein